MRNSTYNRLRILGRIPYWNLATQDRWRHGEAIMALQRRAGLCVLCVCGLTGNPEAANPVNDTALVFGRVQPMCTDCRIRLGLRHDTGGRR